MVSCYNPSTPMFRHQQSGVVPNGGAHHPSPMHSWYTGYHQAGATAAQIQATTGNPYCMHQEEQNNMWHHHHHPTAGPPHGMFANEYPEFISGHNYLQVASIHQHNSDVVPEHHQLPSPPITVSGSEMSSPGAVDNITPPVQNSRPPPARSPYEWIKKPSYQSQPNPGKTRTKDKYRVVYTDHQRIELEKEFTFHNKYITIRRKSELALNLGLSERQVKIWFQNRRAKERKQIKKRAEEKNSLELNGACVDVQNFHQGVLNQQNMLQTNALHHSQHNLINHRFNDGTIENNHQMNDRLMKLELNEDQQQQQQIA